MNLVLFGWEMGYNIGLVDGSSTDASPVAAVPGLVSFPSAWVTGNLTRPTSGSSGALTCCSSAFLEADGLWALLFCHLYSNSYFMVWQWWCLITSPFAS